ncbi:late secretory pathway protein AVL9 homolog [Condylostylus longicornis]|uniref:late secretory pathway protein AVL9 homolog n=1 Tax=Condylostylus longicornis TaxID=2530218 RepID=UPI00244DE8F7|nr:late secretory pathway protein AVL9 homolog [Condylostylus longicornis]
MSEKLPILHIIVVGFHHKKGCQVEFSHPPLIPGTEGKNECPSGWKYFPTLALPDGSHNFMNDTVFFNLPSLNDPSESIYGISCYRQIPVEKLKIRTADVTRSTVQKSVCVLASLPIYGYIEVKLSCIADAFFDQGDFACTDILVKAYCNLNSCLLTETIPMRHFDVGLSLRDIVLKWKHKILILFKLYLLQKRVVCFGSPVRSMCTLIIGIASLYPRLIEKGFKEVACVQTSRPLSPMPDFTSPLDKKNEINIEDKTEDSSDRSSENKSPTSDSSERSVKEMRELIRANSADMPKRPLEHLHRDASVDTLASALFPLASINPDSYNAPLPTFSSGHLCLPYLSLPYMDLLTDPSVLSYVIGTSNVLFQQKKNLADIQVDTENATLDTNDQDLRRQLVLTTEDLRFVDYILRHVQNPKEEAEGSEHWIREQFQGYILALIKTTVSPENQKEVDHFNSYFISSFKKTQCFSDWYLKRPDEGFFEAITSGHPFSGTLSVADMKLKLAQTMNNSESGRKLNQAVNTTSRAVGGALSQAKGAFSNWWSSMTTQNHNLNNEEKSFQNQTTKNCDDKNNSVEIDDDNNSQIKIENSDNATVMEKIESCQEISEEEIKEEISDTANNKTEGIVEIAKEAEMLDNTRSNGKIFTV